MATVLFHRLGEQVTDSEGSPISGGLLYYYRAGTSTLQATYSDAAGTVPNTNPVVLNSAGRFTVPVYLGENYDYKEFLTDSSGATVDPWPFDNIPKAVSTVASANFAYPQVTWETKTASFSVFSTSAGYGYECDSTSAGITVTLVSASSIGSGRGIGFVKIAAGNSVTLTPAGSEKIGGKSTYVLHGNGDFVYITSDGAGWNVTSERRASVLNLAQTSTPSSTPASGNDLIYPKAGDILALKTESAAEKIIGVAPEFACGLTITNDDTTPNTKIAVTISRYVICASSNGDAYRFTYPGAIVCDLGTTGVNGLDVASTLTGTAGRDVYIYAVTNGLSLKIIASLTGPATGPSLLNASGYTHRAYLGAMKLDNSGNLYRSRQRGKSTAYKITAATNTATFPFTFGGATSGYSARQVTGGGYGAPATAAKVNLIVVTNTTSQTAYIAPNADYGTGSNPAPLMGMISGGAYTTTSTAVDVLLESNSVYYNASGANAASILVEVAGWTDEVNAV